MPRIADRFRGFLPVVVDVETGGFNAQKDALLEIAACILRMDDFGRLLVAETVAVNVDPFDGANIDPKSLEVTGIILDSPLRNALPEQEALRRIAQPVRKEVRDSGCQRAILVGHNSFFDLSFLNAAIERTDFKRSPFHPFSSFDTATLAGLAFGQHGAGGGTGVERVTRALGDLRCREDRGPVLRHRKPLENSHRVLTPVPN